MMPSLISLLADPPAKFRPVPFWSWNADLTAEELVRQVRLMKEAGMGGFFMHARGGLQTPYMGDDWFAVTEAVLDAAAQEGMYAWAYDENGWPSGFGDGKVNGLGEAYQLKYFRHRFMDAAALDQVEKLLAVYTTEGKRITDPATASGEIIAVYYEVNPFYVDNADPEVVRTFLNVIYQAYYDRLPAEKRRHLAGFFTDEPQLSRNGIPYSPAMLAEYQKEWGEDLLDRVPELFIKLGEYNRTRVRFWQTLGRCFVRSYSKQLGDWCEEHGMQLTGHMVCEDTLESQTPSNGAVMPHYPHFHIPGMDSLGLALHYFTLPLQVWSAGAQSGRKQLLTETYAGCGWNVSFDDLRYMLNDQMARGANLLCPHLESYTLRGIRKRDYPASLFFHQPWWPHYRKFTDYASRVGMILASGKDPANMLVIHPLSSAHMTYLADVPASQRYTPEDLCNRYFEKFVELGNALDARQCAFHLGDRDLMREMGSVTADGLVIGQMCYQAVVLPELAELSPYQIQLLLAFAEAGFPIVGVKDSLIGKTFSNGEPADWNGLREKIRFFDTAEEAAEAAAQLVPRFSCRTPEGNWCRSLVHCSRLVEDWDGEPAEIHFFTNSDRKNAVDAVIRLPGNSCVEIDAFAGNIKPCSYTSADGFVELRRTIPAGGELLAAVSGRQAALPVIPAEPERKPVILPEEMPIRDVTENLLVLDRCDCLVNGGIFAEDEYVLTLHDKLLDLKKDVPITQIFRFRTAADFRPGKLELLLEQAADHKITVNGRAIPATVQGFFRDPAFQRVDIAGAVQPGENEIRLERLFTQSEKTRHNVEVSWVFESERNKLAFDTEIEAVYLAGDFAVDTSSGTFTAMPDDFWHNAVGAARWELSHLPEVTDRVRYSGDFLLVNPVKTVRLDAVEQSGFPFFAGEMTLETTFSADADGEARVLDIAERRVTVCSVEVNGKPAGDLCWYDNRLAIPPELVKKGENIITLKLVTSLRNMLGPHHLDCGEVNCGSPSVFYQAKGVFCQWEPFPWNRDWCFARMGAKMNR